MLSNRKSNSKNDAKRSVRMRGRTGLIYEEGDKRLLVDSEMQLDPLGVAVYVDSITRWEPPFEKDVISDAERARIVEGITLALKAEGYNIDLA